MSTKGTIKLINIKWLFDIEFHKYHNIIDDAIYIEVSVIIFSNRYKYIFNTGFGMDNMKLYTNKEHSMNKLFLTGALIFSVLGGIMLYTLPHTDLIVKSAYWMPNVGVIMMIASQKYRNTAFMVLCTVAIRSGPSDVMWMAIPILLLVIIIQQERMERHLLQCKNPA